MKKTSKVGYDGRNLMTRIPKKIEEESKLKKGDTLEWEVKKGKLKVKKGSDRDPSTEESK